MNGFHEAESWQISDSQWMRCPQIVDAGWAVWRPGAAAAAAGGGRGASAALGWGGDLGGGPAAGGRAAVECEAVPAAGGRRAGWRPLPNYHHA